LKGDENVCYSPISLYMSLALLAEASGGETRKEVLQVLGSESVDKLEEYATTYMECLELINSGNKNRKVILGNSLWIQKDNKMASTAEDIIKRCQEKMNADIIYEEFSATDINKWTEEKTDGLIKKLLDENNPLFKNLEYAIINTLYIQSRWSGDFTVAGNADFQLNSGEKVSVEYINMVDLSCGYIRGNNYTSVKASLGGAEHKGGAYMLFVCPDDGVSLDSLASEQTIGEILATANSNKAIDNAKVTLRVPKFSYASSIEEGTIKSKLTEMGARTLWKEVDLSGLIEKNGPIFLSFIQKTKIGVDENGIIASAATAITGATSARTPEQEIKLILDRPFMYIIERDGVPLFIGTVYNPTEG